MLIVFVFVGGAGVQALPAAPVPGGDVARSVVRIEATAQVPNYRQPWEPGSMGGGAGSGFVIEGDRILTNAHVVSHARFITVSKRGDPKPYPAIVEHIADDCDLAVLRVYDKSFFDGMQALPIGGLPAMESTVSVYGYPIGGDRLSVTRGVVSRIDFQPYAHSGADSHLAIQIDAAINPGNSGGPVLQDGKVVGVAFQGFRGDVAQNVGYMIPTPVVQRFLRDISDGTYDHYVDLALTYFPLFNPAARKALGVEEADRGVLVGTVFGNGSADGFIQEGDVILSIDGFPVASDGSVELDAENVELAEIVERKFLGDRVKVELLRGGEKVEVEFPLKPFPFRLTARSYREQPRYVTFAGLVFQPVDQDLMEAYSPGDMRLRFLFNTFLSDHQYRERPELVVMSSVLADPVNSFASDFRLQVVEEINETPIRTLEDVAVAFAKSREFHVIRFLGEGRPVVIEDAAAKEAEARIAERYNVTKTNHLEEAK